MTWTFQGQPYNPTPEQLNKLAGMIYLITNTKSGMKYLGKKSFWSLRKPPGKSRRVSVESDWRKYRSSQKSLATDCKANPSDYSLEIIHLCESSAKMNYLETEELFARGVLHDSTYLNENISGKWFRQHVQKYFS